MQSRCPPLYSPISPPHLFPLSILLSSLILLPPPCASSPFLSSKTGCPAFSCSHSFSVPSPSPACGHSPLPPGSCLLQLRAQAQPLLMDSYSGAERDSGGQGACRCHGTGRVQGKGERLQRSRLLLCSPAQRRGSLGGVCLWRLAGVSPGGLLQSRKEGWTDRRQRKPQGAEIKGRTAQKQAGKELASVTGWQAGPSSALTGPGQARPETVPCPPIPSSPPPRAGEWMPSSLSAAQTLARN